MRYLPAILLFIFFTGCGIMPTSDESGVEISFTNTNEVYLTDLKVGGKSIGMVPPNSTSPVFIYDQFSFDSGLPDEDASAKADGAVLTNHDRNYWCGTQKVNATEGTYVVSVSIQGEGLMLSCPNGPSGINK